jgi:hypothetical protein
MTNNTILGQEYRYTFLPEKIRTHNNDDIYLINSYNKTNIILYDLNKYDNTYNNYYISEDPWSIYDKANIDPNTDLITCPVSFNEIPVTDSIIATCCWQAFDPNVFKELKSRKLNCPLCRQELTDHYIVFCYDNRSSILSRLKIGVNRDWDLTKMTFIINKKLETLKCIYRISRIEKPFKSHSDDKIMKCLISCIYHNRICAFLYFFTSFEIKM